MIEYSRFLSKHDAISLLELINNGTTCASQDDFCSLMSHLKRLIQHEYDVCALAIKGDRGEVKSLYVVNISYPSELLALYNEHEWHKIDPLHKENFTQFNLQYWSDTFRKHGTPKTMESVFYDFGIKEGYAHGVRNNYGNKGSIFCFAGKTLKKEKRTEIILELVVPHLHQALSRFVNQRDLCNIKMSPRESEILQWIKQGKSTWDISIIMHISERTVKFHVGNIMKKLGASTRTHAVAIAMEQGLMECD